MLRRALRAAVVLGRGRRRNTTLYGPRSYYSSVIFETGVNSLSTKISLSFFALSHFLWEFLHMCMG